MKSYKYPADCTAVIDVAKPPYSADNTGRIDCTAALRRAIEDVLGAYEKNFNETKAKLEAMDDPNALITFEVRKVEGRCNVIFPEELPPSKIIYFPNGTYLVSDTVSYFFEEFRNIIGDLRHLEMNAQIRLMGESQDGVIIKLKDNCPGFEYGNDRPVISFMQGDASNISQTNMLENMTVSIGSGNPGATGVRYFANNTGAIRNVKIISEDPEHRGNTGLSIMHDKVSAGYIKNLEVVGFNYGVKVTSQGIFTTFEHITLKNQLRGGFYAGNCMIAIRDLCSENKVNALIMDGKIGFVSLIDAKLYGGSPIDVAIRYNYGMCHLRNIDTDGYENVISMAKTYTSTESVTGYLDEYCSHGPISLHPDEKLTSLRLPILETPDIDWDEPEAWVSVNSFGAVGDGIHDDTEAIRRAMKSGKSTVYFNPGKYLINGVIEVPATVNRVNFMYCDLLSGKKLSAMKKTGAFKIVGESEKPLVFEDLYALERFYGFMTFVEHASKRTLIISDLHVQAASMYFNSVTGGKVFIENSGCTIGGIPGAWARKEKLPGEEKFPYDRNTPCFYFKEQEVYCRLLNPERSVHEVINDGGTLWVLGCKAEEDGTAYETYNGGSTEVNAAVLVNGGRQAHPAFLNDNSNVSAFAMVFSMRSAYGFPIAVKEIRGSEEKTLLDSDCRELFLDSYAIPLYVGRAAKKQKK